MPAMLGVFTPPASYRSLVSCSHGHVWGLPAFLGAVGEAAVGTAPWHCYHPKLSGKGHGQISCHISRGTGGTECFVLWPRRGEMGTIALWVIFWSKRSSALRSFIESKMH